MRADDVEEQGRPRRSKGCCGCPPTLQDRRQAAAPPEHPRRAGRRLGHVVPRHQPRLHLARLGRARAERARQHVLRRRAAARQHEGHRRRRLPRRDDRRRCRDRARHRRSRISSRSAAGATAASSAAGPSRRRQRFKAASLGAMVSDWASEYAMGFNHDVRLWYIGGTPWDNPEAYRRQSSYTHIAKVTTPTLLLHGEQDDTDTIGQSMMFYQGLKDRGVADALHPLPARAARLPRAASHPHARRRGDQLADETHARHRLEGARAEGSPDAKKPTTTTADRPAERP